MDEPFADRYSLGEVLGSGGSGVVRLAHDTVLDRQVAIKLLRAGSDDDVLRSRLRSEAQLAGSLHHPGIAQIYDYGEAEADGAATPYIAMQYVEGTPLWSILRDRRTLPVAEVLDLLAQIGAALQVAHAAGIVHRDLKPSNVLVTEAGRAVLVDFGIARSADTDPLTVTGTIVGTADYVSPEQCAGRPATPLSDVYALGLLAYECLSGLKPFHRETPVATALAHLSDTAPPLEDVPDAVRDLVTSMIEKAPEDRPASADEVAQRATALIAAERDETVAMAAPVAAPSDGPPKVLPPAPTPLREAAVSLPPWQRPAFRSRRTQVSAAAVAVALVATAFMAARPAASKVPDVEGMGWSEASAALDAEGLAAERELVDAPSADRGEVLGQDPAAGSAADDDTVVVLTVASGRATLDPADVMGQTYEEAARALVALGLVPERNEVPRPGGDGTVVTAVPSGRLPVGTTVTLNVGVDEPSVQQTAPMTPAPSKPERSHSKSKNKGKAKAKGKSKGHGKKH